MVINMGCCLRKPTLRWNTNSTLCSYFFRVKLNSSIFTLRWVFRDNTPNAVRLGVQRDVSSGQIVRIFKGHTRVSSVAFSPDGQYALSLGGAVTL